MNRSTYTIAFITTLIFLHALDAITTSRLIEMGGVELNPYVNDSSLSSIFLSPPMIAIGIPLITFIIISEFFIGQEKLKEVISTKSTLTLIMVLPFYAVIVKIIAITNNLLVILPLFNPIGWMFMLFENPFHGYLALVITMCLLFTPLINAHIYKRHCT